MNRLRPRLLVLMAVVAAALLLAACSGGTAAPVLDGNGGDVLQPPEQPQPSDGRGGSSDSPGDPQLIVYTGSLDLEVAELRPAMDQAEQVVNGLGGHVAGSRVSNTTDYQTATVSYRIPAEHWAEALTALRVIGSRLVSETTSSENVTAQVVDLEARLDNLRTTEAALQAIMDRATTIKDVLEVQGELTSVRSDIESMAARRDLLSNQAALGTLEITYEVPVPESSRASEGWDLGHELDNAFAALVRLGQGLASLAIWLIVVGLPILIPLVVVVYVAIRVRRRWQTSHPRPEPAPGAAPPAIPPPGPWSSEE